MLKSIIFMIIGALICALGVYNMTQNANFYFSMGIVIIGGIFIIFGIWEIPEDKKYRCKSCKAIIPKSEQLDYCSQCGKILQIEEEAK